jgi:hypothetical protein
MVSLPCLGLRPHPPKSGLERFHKTSTFLAATEHHGHIVGIKGESYLPKAAAAQDPARPVCWLCRLKPQVIHVGQKTTIAEQQRQIGL